MSQPFRNNTLLDELQSQDFLAGLDAIIDITNTTGRLAHFVLEFDNYLDMLLYPEKIIIGDKTSVTFHVSDFQQYSKLTGTPPIFSDTYNNLPDAQKQDIRNGFEEWRKRTFSDPQLIPWIEYPITKKQKDLQEMASINWINTFAEIDPSVVLTTKPNCSILYIRTHSLNCPPVPSPSDLAFLNHCRRWNIEYSESSINPVSMIVGPTLRKFFQFDYPGYHLFAFQEKSQPLDPTTKWDELVIDGLEEVLTEPPTGYRLMRSIGIDPVEHHMPHHKVVPAFYDIKNRRIIDLGIKYNFSSFFET